MPTSQNGPPDDPTFAWFHAVITTYGAWLDGDARGFRTRHHREHVEGDYKNPPPKELYVERRERSRESLKRPPVVLDLDWRSRIGGAVVERLQGLGAFVLTASMSGQHGHLLMKLPRDKPREWIGLAKKHAWFVARDHGWVGQLWGVRSKALPIVDRAHQLNVRNYILNHKEQGAWVWRWQPAPATSPGGAAPGLTVEGED